MYGTGENGWERREEERGEKMVRCIEGYGVMKLLHYEIMGISSVNRSLLCCWWLRIPC